MGGDALKPITFARLDKVLASFSPARGLGVDNWNPRVFLMLLRETRLRLLDLLHLWEESPSLEVLGGEKLIHFIDKAGGGVGPIGLISVVLCIWSKIRSEEAREWERQHAQPFDWGSAEQPCEKASWEHNLLCGWARSKGLSVLSFIADLEKFYEFASHADLLAEATATNFKKKVAAGALLHLRRPAGHQLQEVGLRVFQRSRDNTRRMLGGNGDCEVVALEAPPKHRGHVPDGQGQERHRRYCSPGDRPREDDHHPNGASHA